MGCITVCEDEGHRALTNGKHIVREVGQRQPPVRFAVEVEEIQHRVFSYFPVGRDLSIAVQTYFDETHTAAAKFDKPPEELEPGEDAISISSLMEHALPFAAQKYTFHQSGKLNAKDRTGERMRGNQDIQSIPFDRIEDAIRLCYLYPTLYSRYPRVDPQAGKHHNVFRLVGQAPAMPSIIEVRLSRKSFPLLDKLKEAYSAFAAFVDPWTLETRDESILTVFRKSRNPHFPSTHAFVREFY